MRERSPSDSVEAFARLCREVDAPFAEPARVLADAGLDERRFAEMLDAWRRRLLGEDGDSLRAAFATAYACTESGEKDEASAPAASPGPEPAEEPALLQPPPIVEEMALPTIDVPSFMKAPLPVDAPLSAAPPVPVSELKPQPPITETAAVNVALLLRGPLPFDPQARTDQEAASKPRSASPSPPSVSTGTAVIDAARLASAAVPFAEAERPRAGLSTETAEIDLGKLLRRSVPFSEAPATPTTAELPTLADADRGPLPPPPAPARGRWIRFNPQTGEPLETPYWQELPKGKDK